MKTSKYIIAINAFLLVIAAFLFQVCYTTPHQGSTNPPENTYNQPDQQGYNVDDLNNYGDWVSVPGYGRVWHPSVVSDWAPYDNGHWSYVDGNWTWVSYEPFGWIVYHYGYWYNDSFYGWVWIPSNGEWSPARVRWMNYDNYVCWAPLPPPGGHIVYRNPWDAGSGKYWHSVRRENFARDNVNNYAITPPMRMDTGERNPSQSKENRAPSSDETGSRTRSRENGQTSKENGERSRERTQNPSERNNTGERNSGNRNSSARNETGQRTTTETNPPAKNDIEKASGTKIENSRSRYRDVKTPTKVIKKQELPPEDQKKVDKNEKQVEKKVLVPKKNADKK